MKNGSTFSKILIAVIVALVGIVLTVLIALLLGSSDTLIFDLSDINLANFIPVILIGMFITCAIVGLIILFASKDIFKKIKDYFLEDKIDGGKK